MKVASGAIAFASAVLRCIGQTHERHKCCNINGIGTTIDVASAAIDAVSTVTDISMQYCYEHRQCCTILGVGSAALDLHCTGRCTAIDVASAAIDITSAMLQSMPLVL
jgi:hypothetical protein